MGCFTKTGLTDGICNVSDRLFIAGSGWLIKYPCLLTFGVDRILIKATVSISRHYHLGLDHDASHCNYDDYHPFSNEKNGMQYSINYAWTCSRLYHIGVLKVCFSVNIRLTECYHISYNRKNNTVSS